MKKEKINLSSIEEEKSFLRDKLTNTAWVEEKSSLSRIR
jgi:hypothetical protein